MLLFWMYTCNDTSVLTRRVNNDGETTKCLHHHETTKHCSMVINQMEGGLAVQTNIHT